MPLVVSQTNVDLVFGDHDEGVIRKALGLGEDLVGLAQEFSRGSTRVLPTQATRRVFFAKQIPGYMPIPAHCLSFYNASKSVSSVQVELSAVKIRGDMDIRLSLLKALVMKIKFHYKTDVYPFFKWEFAVLPQGISGAIVECRGPLGLQVVEIPVAA